MAARFWVGNGIWDGANTANWSATSGGAVGVSVPTSADTVTFDANSGSCSVSGFQSCLSLTVGTGFANNFNSGLNDVVSIYGTTGTILTLTPGAASAINVAQFNCGALSGSVNITVNLSGVSSATGYIRLGAAGSTATFTLLTSGNFYSSISSSMYVEVLGGTLSTGTVAPTFQYLYVYNGTFNANASAISFYEVFSIVPSSSSDAVTATLGTSTITATGSGTRRIELGRADFTGTTTITTGATQTINAQQIYIYPTVTATLRTISTPTGTGDIFITLPSGINLTAGAVTSNGRLIASAASSYATLPVLTLTSITGTNTLDSEISVNIQDIGFTCGAISLTYNSIIFGTLLYQETSKGTVNVTGAITLTDNGLFTSPTINIDSQSAFSGSPTIAYAGLNASVRGTINVRPYRNITGLGTITTGTFNDISYGGNVVTTAITLGGTLSSVVYNGVFNCSPATNHNFTATTIGPGTGALVDFSVNQDSAPGSFTTTGAITAHTRFSLRNYGGTVNVAGINVTANVSFTDNLTITGNVITLTSISFSGSALTTSNFVQIGDGISYPVGSSLTISSAVTTGSSATNRLALIIYANNAGISFTTASVVHSISQLIAYNYGALTFVASQTLNLNENSAGTYPTAVQDPLYLTSGSAIGATTLPGTLTSTYTNIAKTFYINAPSSAVTFQGTYTLGNTAATRGNVNITCASYSGNTALSTSGFNVTASGAVSQTGIVTISTTSVSNPAFAIYVSAGTTSTFQGIDASAITDTSQQYDFSFVGGASGTLTIASTITGPTATDIVSRLYISRTAATTFSAAAIITNIRSLEHYAGNVTFTGLGNTTVRRYVLFTAGYTIVFPAAHTLTINGTATTSNDAGVAELDHGGYTYNIIVFSATANRQYIDNTTSSSGLTVGAFTSNGAAVPYSFLVLKTDVNVTASQLTIAPNSITNRHLVCSDAIGTPRTLTAATRTINAGADFQDITAAGATPWNLSAISVGDAGGNSNITFSTPVTRTLAVTTGSVNWDATATWTGAVVPLAHDIADISAGTASLTINTNNRVYLGNVTFGSFAGVLVISNVLPDHTIVTGNAFDLSNVTGSISTNRLTFISRSAATLVPGSVSVFGVAPSIISTLSLTMAGANDLNVASADTLSISSLSFSTNTGSRICNISNSLGGVVIGSSVGTYTSTYSAAVSSNIASSTIYAGGGIVIRNCVSTTPSISTFSGGTIRFQDSVNFTNATVTPGINVQFDLGVSASNNITLGSSVITAKNVLFNAGFTLNSASATINVSESISQTSTSASTWVEGTTQINFTGAIATATILFSFASNLVASTVYRVTINDTASTLGSTAELFLDGSNTNPAIRFFDASAMRRPLRLGSQQLYGGLNAVFSNKAYTYLRTPSQYRIVGADPLYIPYAFCRGANVVSGSIVAYGPANLGSNVGNITFPSRLRYYAFVDTATSMTVPNDYNGMGLLLAIGGGATPSSIASVGSGKGGGGGGGISYTFLLPPNNLTAPVVPGQTIYIRAGAYAIAPVANSVGGNGNVSWANVSSNVAPTTTVQGVLANGGATTTTSTGGIGGSLTGAIGNLTVAGGAGSSSSGTSGGGGGGSARFTAITSTTTNIASGGSGTISASLTTGQGGSGSVSGGAAGIAGLTPTAGANGSSSTGAGGGGGGGNTYNPSTASTSSITRTAGSTALVFNVVSHGLIAGDRIYTTSVSSAKTGTWSKTSTLITATVSVNIPSGHGLTSGQSVYWVRTTGSVVPTGTYVVTVSSGTAFTFVPSVTGTSSGNCSIGQLGISNSTAYAVTVNTVDQFEVTSSFSTVLTSGLFSVTYYPVYVRSAYRGANGGSGALNSAENFIRYYNNVYTPGYFGIGGAGGGAGSILNRSSNLGNSSGNGGDGGIGAGGGGIGICGNLVPATISSVATSGRGGPGLVMLIYALRANNQSAIQGT